MLTKIKTFVNNLTKQKKQAPADHEELMAEFLENGCCGGNCCGGHDQKDEACCANHEKGADCCQNNEKSQSGGCKCENGCACENCDC